MGIVSRKSSSRRIQSWAGCIKESWADNETLSHLSISTFSIFSPGLQRWKPWLTRDSIVIWEEDQLRLEVFLVASKGERFPDPQWDCNEIPWLNWSRANQQSQDTTSDDQCGESEGHSRSRGGGSCWCCQWGGHQGYMSGGSSLLVELRVVKSCIFSLWTCSKSECSSNLRWTVENTGDSPTLLSPCQGLHSCFYQVIIEPVLWLILWEAFSCRRSEIFENILNIVTREEGLAALWKGHLPAQALSVTYGFARWYFEPHAILLICIHLT